MSFYRDNRSGANTRFPSPAGETSDPPMREASVRIPRPKKVESPSAAVALFVDYENLRRGLGDRLRESAGFTARLRGAAEQYGRILVSAAYAEWDSGETASEFRRHQIEPCYVASSQMGDDRANVSIALDAFESLYRTPQIDVYVLVCGDADYRSLLPRLRAAGKKMILLSLEDNPSREALAATDQFVPIDTLLSARRIERAIATTVDFESYDWTPFTLTVRELERQMPFLGFGWLLKKRLNFASCGYDTLDEKQQVMDRAVDDGLLYLYKVPNIDGKTDPVTACKLNPEHLIVKDILARHKEEPAPDDDEAEDESEHA